VGAAVPDDACLLVLVLAATPRAECAVAVGDTRSHAVRSDHNCSLGGVDPRPAPRYGELDRRPRGRLGTGAEVAPTCHGAGMPGPIAADQGQG